MPPRATPQLVVAEGLEPSASGFGHPRSSPVSYATFVELVEWSGQEDLNLRSRAPEARAFAGLSYALMKMKRWRSHGVSIPGLPVDNRMLCL